MVTSHCIFSIAFSSSRGSTGLAYGMVNAVWMVSMVAGIGIGVYLVKRRF